MPHDRNPYGRSMLPPRKRDWKPGTHQIGVFIRTPDGATLEMVTMNPATDEQVKRAIELINCQGDSHAH